MKVYRKTTSRRGFTLLEMMLVVLIIGMLAAAVAWNFVGQGDRARTNITKGNLMTTKQMIVNYQLEKGQYPASLSGLVPEFGEKVLRDGWKREFQYYAPAADRPYALISSGPDGQPGTADDINVWNMDEAAQAN